MAKTEHAPKLGRGKKYANAVVSFDRQKTYRLSEALELVQKASYAKFDETVDVAFNLGVDTKASDQVIRGAIVLPHGTGKSARVAVIAKGDKAKEAQSAGADAVGAEDLIEKISGGWFDFDKLIATPDMMVPLSKIGKVLGPKGLMPNPKLGTVTFDVARAVSEQKMGKVEYRAEKAGIVHVAIGKKSFGPEKLKENLNALTGALLKAKPPTSKGTYLKKITLSTTMGPGVRVDVADAVGTAVLS